MHILVVGGGGREHAIVWALSKSPKVDRISCAPGNAGIAALADCVPVKATDVTGMVAWAKANTVDFVMVAPDDPLAMGMVDALEAEGIPAFGPKASAAVIEASKAFSKDLMAKYHIPTAQYRTFTDMDVALAYVEEQGAPIVVKADGLALGKGVIVAQTVEEAKEAVRSMMADKKFGEAGAKVVIEECMTGPEVTVLAFCDGKHLVPMPSSQDHKRAYDGNKGPNTGGMGSIAPVPCYTPDVAKVCMETIFQPTVDAMAAEGCPFQGVLYFGLMLTPQGPKVVEYNSRFGDPECQSVLSLLDTDLMDILQACHDGTLDQLDIRWKSGAACCLVLASGGYPGSYQKGRPITGLEEAGKTAVVFHAGTAKNEDGTIVTSGGRVLGVTAVGDDLERAIQAAYAAAGHIQFQDMQFRTDIGHAF
ncbi:phosphoribosylamine--glycine ligase [Pseudoflavonifractor sp. MSJ-37]|uniref:phosphoribosylamine--glycine ligase n=1 Tax=Pseudoflavonifractor sp. MSJ-37 TaxID=2841531 RepID=UPI001C0FB3F0|nr:phosphoribosylamine--glycine ligase [Pseudoflavonifractor sp. MSJ-37]MBU5434737.1 phosphoribosylamine--glycine ligase [Pseudoflavonifractor sp. MSJ-37]